MIPILSSALLNSTAVSAPAGATGRWYSDEIVTSGARPYIPNAEVGAVNPPNYLNHRPYGYYDFFEFATSATKTLGQTDSAGGTKAMRILGTGDWSVNQGTLEQSSLVAGNYLCVVRVKSNTGSDQQFNLRRSFGAAGTNHTATTSWQRFTHPFTLASTASVAVGLASFDSATGADLLVEMVGIISGSVDTGDVPMVGHLVLGELLNIKVPTVTAGELNLVGANKRGRIFLPTDFVSNDFTFNTVVRKVANIGGTLQPSLLHSMAPASYGNFLLSPEFVNDTGFYFDSGFTAIARSNQSANPLNVWTNHIVDIKDRGSVPVSLRHDGTSASVWFNGVCVYSKADTAAAVTVHEMALNQLDLLQHHVNAMELYPSAHTDTVMTQSAARLKARAPYLTYDTTANYIVFEGDSLTDGTGLTVATGGPYAYLYKANATQPYYGSVYANSGHKLADVTARISHTLRTINTAKAAGKNPILTIMIGPNDGTLSLTDTSAVYAANLKNRCEQWRQSGSGAKVIYIPILDRTDASAAAGFTTWRNEVNATMLASVGTSIDAYCDLGSVALLGGDGASNDTTYFNADKVHLNAAGQAALEVILRPILNGYLV